MSTKALPEAAEIFAAKKAEADLLIDRIVALRTENYRIQGRPIEWADCGTMSHYLDLLRRLTDVGYREGEYARR